MARFLKLLLSLLLLLLLDQSRTERQANAEESAKASFEGASSPESLVLQLLGELRSTQDKLQILKYVHWSSLLPRIDEERKRTLRIGSAAKLRSFYESTILGVPFGAEGEAAASITELFRKPAPDGVAQRAPNIAREFSQNLYEIKGTNIEGERAWVDLLVSAEGKSRTMPIQLLLVNGKWFLMCPIFVQDPLDSCPTV